MRIVGKEVYNGAELLGAGADHAGAIRAAHRLKAQRESRLDDESRKAAAAERRRQRRSAKEQEPSTEASLLPDDTEGEE